jgi:hypothetical protein
MLNGSGRLSHKRVSIGSGVIFGLVALAAGLVLIRSLPDLVRYMRVRRM